MTNARIIRFNWFLSPRVSITRVLFRFETIKERGRGKTGNTRVKITKKNGVRKERGSEIYRTSPSGRV